MKDLTFSLVQYDIIWEDIPGNLARLETLLPEVPAHSHIVVLPEMFATGFSMNLATIATTIDGAVIAWMRQTAKRLKKIITGSVAILEDGKYYNRLVWMQPDGRSFTYDKRHLFSFAGENNHYTAGNKKLMVQVNGWKICVNICYDLRFPVWLRQSPDPQQHYDVLLLVANWPERRRFAWSTLLKARAIENMAYVIGVNRVGYDGNAIYHSGDSAIIDPLGDIVWEQKDATCVYTHTLSRESVVESRHKFGFLNDLDNFLIP